MWTQSLALRTTATAMNLVESLVERAQAGDADAFRQIYNQYRGMVSKLAYNITGSQTDLEDIVQEIFLQVHRSIRSFQGESKFSTWLYRVAINVSMQYVRQHRKMAGAVQSIDEVKDLQYEGASPEACALEQERRSILMNALEQISPKKRIVFVLHELQCLEAKEIARILKIPTLTVRTRLFYARKTIYRILMQNPAFNEKLRKGREC